MMPPLNTKQLDQSAPTIPTKGWNVSPWHPWGGRKIPRLAPKLDPLIYDHSPNSPACFPAPLAKPQELSVTQLARHVDVFHLVITDNWRPETLSLPHGLAPPVKPTTHFSQAAAL
jgi:hypothetical protein